MRMHSRLVFVAASRGAFLSACGSNGPSEPLAQVSSELSVGDDDSAADSRLADATDSRQRLPAGEYITPTAMRGSVPQLLDPALPDYPDFIAGEAVRSQLSPDGTTLAVLCAGQNSLYKPDGSTDVENTTQYIFLYDVSGENKRSPVLKQVLRPTNSYVGLAFSHDGTKLYSGGGRDDVVYVYTKVNDAWEQAWPQLVSNCRFEYRAPLPPAPGACLTRVLRNFKQHAMSTKRFVEQRSSPYGSARSVREGSRSIHFHYINQNFAKEKTMTKLFKHYSGENELQRASIRAAALAGVLLAGGMVSGPFDPSVASAAPKHNQHHSGPWSFGVISDTQWTVADDGSNPNTVAANIIKQIDQQFIDARVELVIAVGDTVNNGTKDNIDTRALYAQELYNAGIGFYPLRGNHEAAHGDPENLHSALDMRHVFPQIVPGPGAGLNNRTPADVTTAVIPALDLANNPPATKQGHPFFVGWNFSEPTEINQENNAQSYAFQYKNATFVLLDQFNVNGDYYPSTIPDQMDWIDEALSTRPDNTQAFVFTHKNILGGNHKDNMFGQNYANDPGDGFGVDVASISPEDQAGLAAKIEATNEFEALMDDEDVSLVISGHDHHDYLSLVTSPDGQSQVHQLITQSDSSKFYTPATPVSDNDTPIRQDLGRIGYYIFTVDGNEVTIDYYVDDSGQDPAWGVGTTPFHFVKYSTVSYDLDGTEQIVAQGDSYAGIEDDTAYASAMDKGFKGTSMAILAGTNTDTSTTNYGKPVSTEVTTGWTAAEPGLQSDILNLGGMSLLPGEQTDEYVLSMSTGPANGKGRPGFLRNGNFILLTKNESGDWVNAVSENIGGTPNFVRGSWDSSYALGTYGIDPKTDTVWAVLNHDGEFAIGHQH